jgi:hypothetical protein
MAKKITNKVLGAASSSTTDKEFEDHLNNILKKYKKQQDLLNAINQLNRNSNTLAGTLNQQQQQILNNTLRQYQAQLRIKSVLGDHKMYYNAIMGSVKYIYDYLEKNDGFIKTSALNLGLSRSLSNQYRDNLIASSEYAASLGMSVENLAKVQEAYTTETGQSAIFSERSLRAVTLLTQGTSLSAENAGTLVGQFKLLGLNAEHTKDFVESTAIDTGKLGISFGKVIKNITENFSKIQSFNFQNGINGVQKMAMYASMYNINMSSAFASMEKSRTLEGAVEMSAKLMVMGGEFSKQNMFELAFLSRNKPEEYMKKLNEMTRSTYFFNKQTGEFQTSAFDLDRLRAVSEATGIPFEEMTKSARRLAEIDFAKTKMLSGLSSEDKDFVANMAQFNKSTGKFEIQLGSNVLDVASIGKQQIALLKTQNDSLDQRAKDSATFDKAFTNAVEELKAMLLPALVFLNDQLRKLQDWGAAGKVTAISLLGAAITGVAYGFSKILALGMNATFNGFLTRLQAILTKSSLTNTTTGGGGGGGGKGFMGKLGGAAGAAVAVGGAFLAASYGIKMIAESFKELNPEQLNAITAAIVTMGISIPLSLYAISSAGTAANLALPGLGMIALVLGSIGFAAMGVGKGIEFASNGLGNMFSKLTPEIAESISKIGWGFGQMGLGLASFAIGSVGLIPLTALLASLSLFKGTLSSLSELSTSMANGTAGFNAFGSAIEKIGMVNNDKTIAEIRGLINDLNNMEMINPLTELKELLSKPLKVEFADQNVNMVVNVSNILDGKVLAKNVYPHLVKLIKNNAQNK